MTEKHSTPVWANTVITLLFSSTAVISHTLFNNGLTKLEPYPVPDSPHVMTAL